MAERPSRTAAAADGLAITAIDDLGAVEPADWDALAGDDDPFVEHAFLRALETSGSVGRGTGWRPCHLTARRQGRLVGAVPTYLKTDSYGEFIFDWGWAAAAQRAGLRYYPKLVVAVPFTPATGPRLLVGPAEDGPAVRAALARGLLDLARERRASSVHVLFAGPDDLAALEGQGFGARLSMQFHWRNRTPEPYRDFEDFLAGMRAESRKQIRRERRVAAEHGLVLETREGRDLTAADWQILRALYLGNCERHGATPYLTEDFFAELRAHHGQRVVTTMARRDAAGSSRAPAHAGHVVVGRGGQGHAGIVAATLDFEKGRHLFGRYWGAFEEHPMLHFELAYHRLVERAIARRHDRFEAGAQGEHKLKRGLLPAFTHSAHWIADEAFARAVSDFLVREARAVREAVADYQHHGPSRRGALTTAPERAIASASPRPRPAPSLARTDVGAVPAASAAPTDAAASAADGDLAIAVGTVREAADDEPS